MLKLKLRKKSCNHSITTLTETSGLVRTICLECGHISFQYRDDVVHARREMSRHGVPVPGRRTEAY